MPSSPPITHKKAPSKGGKHRQTTAMKKPRVDPMTGVVKPEILTVHIKECCGGMAKSRSYLRGAIQVLERKPPNLFIVPLLKKALEKFRERNQ